MQGIAVEFLIIVLLLGLNAFLAASEISLVSVRKVRLRSLAEDGDAAAGRVLQLTDNPSGFLATVQVGITLASFFASAVGAVSLVAYLAGWLDDVPVGFIQDNARTIGLIAITALLSFMSIVFGELIPKTLAVHRADSLALKVARPIQLLATITAPIVALLTGTTNLVLRLIGVEDRARMPSVSTDELLAMVETAEDEGVVGRREADLIEEAFQFGQTTVRAVMVPRVDVLAIQGDAPLDEAMERFFASGFSRLPAVGTSIDDVLGILYLKDVSRLLWAGEAARTDPVKGVVRPAYFVPESKPIDELLSDLRRRRTHVALVIDEFGGLAGLVTLEDLMEELVGEIADEFDPDHLPFQEAAPGTLDVDGRVSIADLLDRLDLKRDALGEVASDSVGGLIVDLLGRFPRQGDTVAQGPLRLTVRKMSGLRVSQVRVEQREPRSEELDGAAHPDDVA